MRVLHETKQVHAHSPALSLPLMYRLLSATSAPSYPATCLDSSPLLVSSLPSTLFHLPSVSCIIPDFLLADYSVCHLLARWFLAELIFSTLKMEAVCSSETSVDTQRTTQRHIPEDGTLQKMPDLEFSYLVSFGACDCRVCNEMFSGCPCFSLCTTCCMDSDVGAHCSQYNEGGRPYASWYAEFITIKCCFQCMYRSEPPGGEICCWYFQFKQTGTVLTLSGIGNINPCAYPVTTMWY
jgi:hypothetical protein